MMSPRLPRTLVMLALLAAATPTLAGWTTIKRTTTEGRDGVRLVNAQFRSEPTRARVQAALFDAASHDIRVHDAGASLEADIGAVARAGGWLAAVNGSYFHPDGEPLGLVISGGRELHRQERASLLSGILAANSGRIHLLRPAEFKRGPDTQSALQAGPFLVDGGQAVTGLESTRRARRTIVATDGRGRWLIGTVSPLTLAETGSLLAADSFAEILAVRRALNLDGGSSSAFHFQRKDGGAELVRPLTGVRNFLGVVKR